MNKIIRLAIANLLLMPVILFAAEPQAELKNLEGVINIADTIGNENIAKRAALAVGIANPKLKITILKMSVPDAVAAVGSGKADLILLDQRLPQKLRGKIDYKLYRYAANPAVIAVNVKNTLNSITSQQLRDIFSGNIES
ncbi:MAG: substrate-binding domain-containing protein, partial [Victivallaceae bacterium]